MKLVHRSARARDPVRSTSSGGEIFVTIVVMMMFLAVLGDILEPTTLGETGLEYGLFDMRTESVLVAVQHWSLLQMMMAAGAAALGLSVIHNEIAAMARVLISSTHQGLGKIPI